MNISSTHCDLTQANISAYGLYSGSVKAVLGEESSDWVNSNEVSPDMDSEDQPSAGLPPPPPTPAPLHRVFSLPQPPSGHQTSLCCQA